MPGNYAAAAIALASMKQGEFWQHPFNGKYHCWRCCVQWQGPTMVCWFCGLDDAVEKKEKYHARMLNEALALRDSDNWTTPV